MPAAFPNPISLAEAQADPEAVGLAVEYLERSGDLHCVLGQGWRIEWMAGAWEETLGWSSQQLGRVSLEQFLHPAGLKVRHRTEVNHGCHCATRRIDMIEYDQR